VAAALEAPDLVPVVASAEGQVGVELADWLGYLPQVQIYTHYLTSKLSK
jgi:hypothetical protein